MATADRHIGDLNVELARGQGRSIKFTDLLTTTSTTVGQWTAVAGANLAQAPTCTEDSGSLLVSWSDSQATASIGRSWRLRLDGHDVAGGRVVEARPQATPGTASVAIQVDPLSEVTTTVVVTPAGPKGDQGDQGDPGDPGPPVDLSSATPAPLGTASAGAATVAAKGDHVHAMPSAADVGADPTGTAASAVSAHTGDAVGAHAASAVAFTNTVTGMTATDTQAAIDELATDTTAELAALPQIGAGLTVTAGEVEAVPTDVQDFAASGTWTKPADVTAVCVIAVGAGGPGGSGRRGAAGTFRAGGSGGGSGAAVVAWLRASDLTSTVAVTIGASGAVGAGVTANDTSGNAGSAGTSTSFGSYVVAKSGAPGAGGAVAPAADAVVQQMRATVPSSFSQGLGAISYDLLGLGLLVMTGGPGHAGGGGCGSWISVANGSPIIGSVGGDGTGGAGGNGAAGAAGSGPLGGGGGGGGHTGNGFAGGTPGGGGGGGRATLNGTTSGAGGAGGAGFLRVLAFR